MRCTASPFMFLNYSSSYIMQGVGNGKGTFIHAFAREIIFYIPFMFILDRIINESGVALALPVGEACGAVVALLLVRHTLKKTQSNKL